MSIYSCSAWQHIEKRQRQLEYAGCKTSMSGMSMLYLYKIWIRLFSAYSACGWQLTTMKEHNQHGIWICHKCDDVKWPFARNSGCNIPVYQCTLIMLICSIQSWKLTKCVAMCSEAAPLLHPASNVMQLKSTIESVCMINTDIYDIASWFDTNYYYYYVSVQLSFQIVG